VKVDGYKQPERCWEVLVGVPMLNQRVMVYILDFLRDLGRPEYSSVTKMDVDNLAMVFAPLFLCCPDSSLLFFNSVYEATFVQNLLTTDPSAASIPAPSTPAVASFVPSPRSSPIMAGGHHHHSMGSPSPPSSPIMSSSVYSSLASSSSSVPSPATSSSPLSSAASFSHSPSTLRARRSITPRSISSPSME
jgi:hypothetical protein